MIIFQNSFLILNYEPSTDILYVDIPDVPNLFLTELIKSYDIIVEHVRTYDVKKLLLDATKTKVEVDEEALIPVISDFITGLKTTRLQKVARVISSVALREKVVQKAFEKTDNLLHFKSFTEVTAALNWLKQP